jgi:hypothetical protein
MAAKPVEALQCIHHNASVAVAMQYGRWYGDAWSCCSAESAAQTDRSDGYMVESPGSNNGDC